MARFIDADALKERLEDFSKWCRDGRKQGVDFVLDCPYGRQIGRWVEKAFREAYAGQCRTAVLLLPARTETKWFHDFIYHRAQIRFIRGRIRFDGAVYNAPFPSMVVIFRGETA